MNVNPDNLWYVTMRRKYHDNYTGYRPRKRVWDAYVCENIEEAQVVKENAVAQADFHKITVSKRLPCVSGGNSCVIKHTKSKSPFWYQKGWRRKPNKYFVVLTKHNDFRVKEVIEFSSFAEAEEGINRLGVRYNRYVIEVNRTAHPEFNRKFYFVKYWNKNDVAKLLESEVKGGREIIERPSADSNEFGQGNKKVRRGNRKFKRNN
jgi:hypothetical protein